MMSEWLRLLPEDPPLEDELQVPELDPDVDPHSFSPEITSPTQSEGHDGVDA